MQQLKQTDQNNSEKTERWISVKHIADYCLVSRTTVRRWIQEAKLSAIRLPSRHYRVSSEDFKSFLNKYGIPIREELLRSEVEKERR
jgi:excisionase family DNA binding protein